MAAGLPLLAMACSVDVMDGAGPLVPKPNLQGTVMRAGGAASDIEVELSNPDSTAVTARVYSNWEGLYEFFDVAAGAWEVKVSGGDEGDFDSISLLLDLPTADTLFTIASVDIFAHGALPLTPPDSSTQAIPNPFSPLRFAWELPTTTASWARVQLYDLEGQRVWNSEKNLVSEANWNGIGNEGDYAGEIIPAGDYYWRVKIHFPDGTEAKLSPNQLRFE